MQDLKTYLSTAPVLAISSFIFLAGLLIEINRFFSRCSYFCLFLIVVLPLKSREKILC
jgi:hypothetical protein